MSKKQLFTIEFPVRCSPGILFEFLSTASGLQEWFADKVDEWENAGEKLGKALRLRYIDGMTYDQIAEALELSRDQVKRTLAEGKERLKNIANRS
jgi:DNA-directed RNA polymerase specialized sigma24 family protein